ncbi:uncharacterized protein OCT59_013837 [Rhizophagus irregularis]|uniref:Uncharacterized protein n=1 Tax=Rhizophagus irregularis TaxID=588596 RepID=A0A2I1FIJ6_9GLOM|nr:hypothetical protein RhiirB3_395358 [Rhizophagus irregularis]GBC23340.2 hypothetical protein GLOIN_2v1787554 [Rhizophagus irregularis DAOM 181602=DAOM 197198]UZO21444.1 hypothetical protein OCT59_013837 [Rhizophagus irregularis]CAB4494676.1 unnamed protein product [Rhizophagus irregularis]CAB5211513.1 unnamed protein product [Rhizophagus irregularis]
MIQYLRSDVTHLSAEDIQDIIKAKNSMKRASEVMANKYKILTRWVYQIWRDAYPPIDPKDIKSLSEEPGAKKEIISSTEFSEDVLDLYKKTDNTLEGIKARGRPLITK